MYQALPFLRIHFSNNPVRGKVTPCSPVHRRDWTGNRINSSMEYQRSEAGEPTDRIRLEESQQRVWVVWAEMRMSEGGWPVEMGSARILTAPEA